MIDMKNIYELALVIREKVKNEFIDYCYLNNS